MKQSKTLTLKKPFNWQQIKILASPQLWLAGLIAAVLLLIMAFWFASYPYHTFMGDDLIIYLNSKKLSFFDTFTAGLTQTPYIKWRPVIYPLHYLQMNLLGDNFRNYIYFNIVIELLNSGFVALIVWHLSKRRWPFAFGAGLLMIVSRFAYFYVLQVSGFLEALALFFMLLILATTLLAYAKKKPIFFIWPLTGFLLVILTHERYIVLAAFVALAILLVPATFQHWYSRFAWTSVPFWIILINYLFKTFILKIQFFTGTGGTNLSFNPKQFLTFMWNGFINMFGFNAGPDYLSGLDMAEAGWLGIAMGWALFIPMASLFLLYLRQQLSGAVNSKEVLFREGRKILLYLVLFGSVLLSASITIRQEYRWLYPLYAVVIIGLAYLVGQVGKLNWLHFSLILWILIAAIGVDTYYRNYLSNVFFVQGMRAADAANTAIVEKYGPELAQTNVYIINNGLAFVKGWYFWDNLFFQFYTHNPAVKVTYVGNLDSIPADPKILDKLLVFSALGDNVQDITQEARGVLAGRSTVKTTLSFDFVKEFSKGKLSSMRRVESPNNLGVFEKAWLDKSDNINSFTILSGFNYYYKRLEIKPGDLLSFELTLPNDNTKSDGALAYVEITDQQGQKQRIVSTDVAPASDGVAQWASYIVPLPKFSGQKVTFIFGVESPSGDAKWDWIAFSNVKLLSSQP